MGPVATQTRHTLILRIKFAHGHSAALKDLRFVVKALKTLSSRWEDIGMTVDIKDLDGIKKNYRGTHMYVSHKYTSKYIPSSTRIIIWYRWEISLLVQAT